MRKHIFSFSTKVFFPTSDGEMTEYDWIAIPSNRIRGYHDLFEIEGDDGETVAIFYKHAITSVVIIDDNE